MSKADAQRLFTEACLADGYRILEHDDRPCRENVRSLTNRPPASPWCMRCGCLLRQPAAKDVSHAELARAMHLESRATAQFRRRMRRQESAALFRTPCSQQGQWEF